MTFRARFYFKFSSTFKCEFKFQVLCSVQNELPRWQADAQPIDRRSETNQRLQPAHRLLIGILSQRLRLRLRLTRPPEAPLEVYPEVSVFEGSKRPNPCPDLAYLRAVWGKFCGTLSELAYFGWFWRVVPQCSQWSCNPILGFQHPDVGFQRHFLSQNIVKNSISGVLHTPITPICFFSSLPVHFLLVMALRDYDAGFVYQIRNIQFVHADLLSRLWQGSQFVTTVTGRDVRHALSDLADFRP
jgi:hypothetical protein